MDLQTGNFLHWPLGGSWSGNAEINQALYTTWQAWRFFVTAKEREKRAYTVEEMKFEAWLEDGRPVEEYLSDMDRWWLGENIIEGEIVDEWLTES